MPLFPYLIMKTGQYAGRLYREDLLSCPQPAIITRLWPYRSVYNRMQPAVVFQEGLGPSLFVVPSLLDCRHRLAPPTTLRPRRLLVHCWQLLSV